jgi:hypothetical protein
VLIGEVAKQSGASRKALRLYEEAGILTALGAPRRAITSTGATPWTCWLSCDRLSGSASAWMRWRSSRLGGLAEHHARTFGTSSRGSGRSDANSWFLFGFEIGEKDVREDVRERLHELDVHRVGSLRRAR